MTLGNTPADKNYKPSGISRAEEAALEAYPDYPTMDGGYVIQRKTRKVFKQGYKAAEKDLSLTWEDVKEIVRIADTMMDFDPNDRPEWMESDKAYYTEVLKQFKEGKQ